MDEAAALGIIGDLVEAAGDDAAVVEDLVLTTDMLHETTDFPEGVTPYTAGWRAVGASLSDLAAMGARAIATLGVYAAPTFEEAPLRAFIAGAQDVCEAVDARYVGGDLDQHDEFTVATTAVGRASEPVFRTGAKPGDDIFVTGTLGRSAVALALFEEGKVDRANELFRFRPRIRAGRLVGPSATAMMDSSDGLARSLHQLARASECGMAIDSDRLPLAGGLESLEGSESDRRDRALYFGEDFELILTAPSEDITQLRDALSTPLTAIGTVTESRVTIDGEPLPNRGYTHGDGD